MTLGVESDGCRVGGKRSCNHEGAEIENDWFHKAR